MSHVTHCWLAHMCATGSNCSSRTTRRGDDMCFCVLTASVLIMLVIGLISLAPGQVPRSESGRGERNQKIQSKPLDSHVTFVNALLTSVSVHPGDVLLQCCCLYLAVSVLGACC